jgi:hypothetical protein
MGKWIDFLIYHAYDPTQHLGFSAFKPSENSSPCALSPKQVWFSVKETVKKWTALFCPLKQSTLVKSLRPLTKRLGQP